MTTTTAPRMTARGGSPQGDGWQRPEITFPTKRRKKATWGKGASGRPTVKEVASWPGYPQPHATHEQLVACFAINAIARSVMPYSGQGLMPRCAKGCNKRVRHGSQGCPQILAA